MKFKVHRVRFVDYTPQAIHCLAFEDVKVRPRLALSRADSSIEIWCPRDDWFQQMIIPGCSGTSVESVVWCGRRLFSAGLNGEIIEWDLGKLAPKVSVSSLGGAVWSLVINHAKTLVAAGCEDGCTRIFEITPDGLQYTRALDKQNCRILSLSWHISDNIIVTGSSDSTVKVYDIKTGHCTLRITMDEFESRNTLIWGVHITRDFTIITGDSLGNTQFWDGHTGTLIESFKAHKADVLCLCVNEDEDTVFSSGVDSKVVSFKLTVTNQTQKPQWVKTVATRAHTHDVRALSVLGSGNMLVSGGVDTKLGVYSLSKFFKSQPRMVPAFPHHPLVSIASDANILMYQWQNSLRFWKLGETDLESTVVQSPPAQLLQMNAKGDNHIVCSAITPCSKWVAFSDISHVSMFRVNMIIKDSETVKVSRVLPLPPDLLPAQRMVFTKDGSKLICATNQHSIQVLETGDEVTIAASFCLPGNEKDLPAMCLLAASDNGRWVACVDSLNAVNVLDLKYTKHHSTLPTFGSHVTALAFQPETQHLAIVCANKQIFIYHTKSSKLTHWSKQAASKGLPKQWVQRHNKVVDVTFSPACHDVMILQDHELFALIDMRGPLPDPDVKLFDKKFLPEENRKRANSSSQDRCNAKKSATPNKKQKAKTNEEDALEGTDESTKDTQQNAFKICKKYGPLLFLGFCQDESMVVVERSWVNVVETLPPALSRKRYGKS